MFGSFPENGGVTFDGAGHIYGPTSAGVLGMPLAAAGTTLQEQTNVTPAPGPFMYPNLGPYLATAMQPEPPCNHQTGARAMSWHAMNVAPEQHQAGAYPIYVPFYFDREGGDATTAGTELTLSQSEEQERKEETEQEEDCNGVCDIKRYQH